MAWPNPFRSLMISPETKQVTWFFLSCHCVLCEKARAKHIVCWEGWQAPLRAGAVEFCAMVRTEKCDALPHFRFLTPCMKHRKATSRLVSWVSWASVAKGCHSRPCLGDLPWTSAPTRSEISTERVVHGLFPLGARLTKWLSSLSLWTGSWCCTPTRPLLLFWDVLRGICFFFSRYRNGFW